jgi:hypothetical protein
LCSMQPPTSNWIEAKFFYLRNSHNILPRFKMSFIPWNLIFLFIFHSCALGLVMGNRHHYSYCLAWARSFSKASVKNIDHYEFFSETTW